MRRLATTLLAALGLGLGLWPGPTLAQDADRQVAQGEAIYARRCAKCHGANGEGKMGPSLVGPQHHLSGYGTADVLFDYTRQIMPADRPGRMQEVEYWAVLALSSQGQRPAATHRSGERDGSADPARSLSLQIPSRGRRHHRGRAAHQVARPGRPPSWTRRSGVGSLDRVRHDALGRPGGGSWPA